MYIYVYIYICACDELQVFTVGRQDLYSELTIVVDGTLYSTRRDRWFQNFTQGFCWAIEVRPSGKQGRY